MAVDLSVVVVNFNTRDMLQLCLESVYSKVKGVSFEVFVVDNGSRDGSAEMAAANFPETTVLRNKANLGFAAANNLALRQCSGEFVLLLNPDCFLLDSIGGKEIEFMKQHQDVAVFGARLLNADGSRQYSCRSFPTYFSPLFGRTGIFTRLFPGNAGTRNYLLGDANQGKAFGVDWVTGAFMLLRKSALDSIGFFDEDFFLFCDDLDLCYRAKEQGHRVVYYPGVRALHLVGASMDGIGLRAVLQHHKSMLYFFRKHYNPPHFLRPFIALGAAFNLLYYLFAFFVFRAKTLLAGIRII